MNWPTIIIAAIVATLFILIVVNEVQKKKRCVPSCSCGCGGCAFKDTCHQTKNNL